MKIEILDAAFEQGAFAYDFCICTRDDNTKFVGIMEMTDQILFYSSELTEKIKQAAKDSYDIFFTEEYRCGDYGFEECFMTEENEVQA